MHTVGSGQNYTVQIGQYYKPNLGTNRAIIRGFRDGDLERERESTMREMGLGGLINSEVE